MQKNLSRVRLFGACLAIPACFLPVLLHGFYGNPVLDIILPGSFAFGILHSVLQRVQRDAHIPTVYKLLRILNIYETVRVALCILMIPAILNWGTGNFWFTVLVALTLPSVVLLAACVIFWKDSDIPKL